MIRVGIIGDFRSEFESHRATNGALAMAAAAAGVESSVEWLPTAEVTERRLARYDGFWASPGSPYASMEGMLSGIRYARERGKPFVGT
jgi:CTP synthase (UTP-ammonia lyase)